MIPAYPIVNLQPARLALLILLLLAIPRVHAQADPRWGISVPELSELAHIAFAMTDVGRKGAQGIAILDTAGPYSLRVRAHFAAVQGHPLVTRLNRRLDAKGLSYLISNRNFANHYTRQGGKLRTAGVFPFPRRLVQAVIYGNAFRRYRREWEDFAEVSGFADFYAAEQATYAREMRAIVEAARFTAMLDWLAREFQPLTARVEIIYSPLVGDAHSAFAGRDGTRYIVVPGVDAMEQAQLGAEAYSAVYSGICFTEIDHHYCDPATEHYRAAIEQAFAVREMWVDTAVPQTAYYKSAQDVFNEYFTHAVHLLYVQAQYAAEVADQVVARRIKLNEKRGWRKFADFFDALRHLNAERKATQAVIDLLPDLMDWAKEAGAAKE